MNSMLTSQSSKPKSTRLKKLVIGSCGVIALSIVVVAGLLAFALWGGGGEPATLNIAIRVTREFVQAIHDQQIDTAYSMLSEKFSPQITKEQFAALIQQDEDIFNTYRELNICDWGFFISDGRVITTSGLLYYGGAAIVVEISLHKDSDTIWRIQGFQFRSDINPTPFGLCQ